jgi:hypothetical protein
VLVVVTVVQHERALGREEREEAGADEPGDMPCVADRVDRLGEYVEEGDRDHDAARERDQGLELPTGAKRDLPLPSPTTIRGGRGRGVAKSCL